LKPALEHAEKLVREGANFTSDFKAVRSDLRKLDERVEALGQTASELAAGQAAVASNQATVAGELRGLDGRLMELGQQVTVAAERPTAPAAPPAELRQLQEQVGSLQQVIAASAQAQAAGVGELRGELRTLSAGQQRSAQELRTRLDLELRQQEARFRDLAEKFLVESAQLRARLEAEQRAPLEPPRRQVVPVAEEAPKPELDAETRKEFRKIAERLDGLQRRMEEIIRL
jgi:tetrahydromethanopterin S-methyltransferase subunit G